MMRDGKQDVPPGMDGCVLTVGTFDGVHRGHQEVIGYVVARARERGKPAVVVTFDPHPRTIVRGHDVRLLTTVEERAGLLKALGVDQTVVLPFTQEFARMPAAEFVESILVHRLRAAVVVIGYDHGFGRRREGNAALLHTLAPQLGFEVDVIPPHIVAHHAVSSSLIRSVLMDQGNAEEAAHLLGRPYRLEGTVVQGDARGRLIGFPTANLRVDPQKLVPRNGVYAVRVTTESGVWPGMMNIGTRPTFDGVETRLEVHLLGFEGDLYGTRLSVEFISRLRDERRFDGIDALRKQLEDDAERCSSRLRSLA